MNVLITGGTGFIGSALCRRLLEDKHVVTVLTRHPDTIKAPLKSIVQLEQLKDELVFNSVINLAGESIANKRWSDKQKQRICHWLLWY
ncbi:MAG: NAD-dependent epimerase/dehydratase family protein [Methylococcales bacterium]|jgi:NAD dependent epimerase/dehydratase family enzyme